MSKSSSTPRRKRHGSPLIWHCVGLTVLGLVAVGLILQLAFDWTVARRNLARAASGETAELNTLTIANVPLRGLDKRVADTRGQIDDFFAQRIPATYSSIAIRIGELEVQSGVRLSQVVYSQGAQGADLTEISIDTGISGQYPQIMRFVNGLERDREFFVIRAMTFSGQQGGLVNLRLRFSTWLRPAEAAASGLPATASARTMPGHSSANEKE
jgi:type IV pilus assembly protein PilO